MSTPQRRYKVRMVDGRHWTEGVRGGFVHSIIAGVCRVLNMGEEGTDEMTRTQSIEALVYACRSFGWKLALVPYDDGDADNLNGPVDAEIFRICWERAGKPRDFFELDGK